MNYVQLTSIETDKNPWRWGEHPVEANQWSVEWVTGLRVNAVAVRSYSALPYLGRSVAAIFCQGKIPNGYSAKLVHFRTVTILQWQWTTRFWVSVASRNSLQFSLWSISASLLNGGKHCNLGQCWDCSVNARSMLPQSTLGSNRESFFNVG